MGLFKRKREKLNKIEFTEYNNHRAKKKRASLLTSFDRMEYSTITNSSKETLLKLCDTILSGKAVLANFDKLEIDEITEMNEMLAFISGVVYAKEGEIHRLDDRLFLFGRKEEFEDGSLNSYVEDSK